MKPFTLVIVCAAYAVACSATPTVIPTKNMDRPTDMAFVCLAMVDGALSGQPMSQCHVRNQADPQTTSNGERTLGTFAFIPNATRGELAVADMDHSRLLDLAPAAPGYGMLPVGGDPECVAASYDGCWVATANRTTCDFTLVDPSRLLAHAFTQASGHVAPATGEGGAAYRVPVYTSSGRRISTATGEIAFLPSASAQRTCQVGVAPKAVATFPGCDMVALLDFTFDPTGTTATGASIASAYYVRPDLPGGYQDAGGDPMCPTDCTTLDSSDAGSEAAGVDAGTASDGGETIDAGSAAGGGAGRLQPLALVPDGSRVYVGSLRDAAVFALDITPAGLGNPTRLDLVENPVGTSRLRLSVDPYLTSAGALTQGQFLPDHASSKDGRFLYAFAADDSVRVVDITNPVPVECDVNLVPNAYTRGLRCVPVGSPLAPRRALAKGPGLRVPTFSNPDSPPPLPRDLAFADLQPTATDGNAHSLSGKFGFLLASNGQVYVVNLAPNGEDNTTPTHSFREVRDIGKFARTALAVSIAPQRSPVVSDQAFATTASFGPQEGPLIKAFSTDGVTTSWFVLPDPDTIISRGWDVVWEGTVPDTSRASGRVRPVTVAGLATVGLVDQGADFCGSGVRAGDVLMFAGCTRDSDCQPDDTFNCQVTVSGARGVCLPRDGGARAALLARPECARFMGSRLRYEVAAATPTALALNLKLDEVPKTSLNPCTQDADCQPDADHGLLAGAAPDGGIAKAFECVEVRPAERRCVQKCKLTSGDADCRAGNVCELVPGMLPLGEGTGLCVEAPPLEPTCLPQPMTSYSVRAGNSYMVYGTSLPRMRTSRVSAAGTCEVDKTANPALVDRIPLSAPQCPESFLGAAHPTITDVGGNVVATAAFVQGLSAQPGSNPCLYTGARMDGDINAVGMSEKHIRAFYENPQIRFVLTNLEQYAGDLLSIHFEFQYGFVPLVAQIPTYEVQLTMPTRILTGPTMTPESPIRRSPPADITYPYIYVVDQGRTVMTPASRGQVLRINPRAGSNEIVTFDTAMSGSTPFQLQ
jgi:hypothetical protein